MNLQLYYFPTPNGRKVSIALEEMRLSYSVEIIDILKGDQSQKDFLAISPNGKIPALIDPGIESEPVVLFESGAILQYLGLKTALFYPQDEVNRTQVDAWLFWQVAHLGPMTGQVTWFKRAAEKPNRDIKDTAFAIRRYEKEMHRLYEVLEVRLQNRDYICDTYSIADMACWPWVDQHHNYLGELTTFPCIAAWHQRIASREAVQRAMQLGMDQVEYKKE